jgi:hypothetical protein
MRAKISWLLSVALVFGAAAATAQSFPCASVAPEVRDRVREAGACRDATPSDAAPTDAAPASSAVTVRLSDGTVVRVPREIGSIASDERKRAVVNDTAARAKVSPPSEPEVSGDPAPALQKAEVPDSSIAGAADTTPVTAPTTAAAASSTAAPATDAAPATAAAPVPASEPTAPPAPRGRPPIAFPANAALILGAGVLLGLLFGALLMRQWLLRRAPASDASAVPNAVPPTLSQHQQPVETGGGVVSETGAAPEVRFAARREPGETTIVLAPRPGGDEVAIEHSSDRHA